MPTKQKAESGDNVLKLSPEKLYFIKLSFCRNVLSISLDKNTAFIGFALDRLLVAMEVDFCDLL